MNSNRTRLTSRSQNQPKRRAHTRALVFSLLLATCMLLVVASGALLPNGIPGASASRGAQRLSPKPSQGKDDGISAEALAQIEALVREKELRTDVQKKIDSQLLYRTKMNRGLKVAENVATLQTDVVVDDQGKTTVDITATITNELMATLQANGAEILSARNNNIRALVSLESLERIAALDEVKFVQPKQDAMTATESAPMVNDKHDVPSNYEVMPGFEQRAASVRSFLSNALRDDAQTNVTGTNAPSGVGSRSSEGDVTHRANIARGTFHIDGTGIKIGVLSNGVTSLSQSQALGDLGPVTVLPGQAGTGDEGTAMLEIVHDLAPGAQLFYATGNTGITTMAQNIRDLRTAGCDIIVDDILYFVETPFQDGQLAPTNTNGGAVIQAVNDVTAAGAMYFSSAGNSGNLAQGSSGVWEGDFVDGGPGLTPLPTPTPALRLHNFGSQNFNVLNVANTAAPISLYWSDPLGASSNDYDLFRLNSTGTTVQASSTNIQSGTQDPYEQVTQAVGSRIVIVKKPTAADRFLHLNANRGQFSIRTAGTTHGHSHAADAFSCAASPANTPFGVPPNPVGPFPNPFSAANITELFSSDGPRRIFFQANGTPYTPGDFSSTGGIVRQKPDITAADGVQVTGVGGFGSPFFGTSAAAPHAAAIAGLLKSANPSLTPAQIRTALTSTAIDIMSAGTDQLSGAGIIDAFSATQSLGVAGTAFLQSTNITALENPGNGNGVLDSGENATMTVQLRNDGVNAATAISATLSSSTPGVTITQGSSAYPDLAVGASGTNTTAFQFTIEGFVTCPTTLNFSLTLNYTGGPSQVLNFSVLSGPTPTVISSTLDTTPPSSGAGFTGTTGALTIRHFRDNVISSCGTAKAFPGTSTPGNHQYDAYAFQTCANSGPTCVTVTLSAANGVNLFTAAYLGTFNPANLAQNYLADAGGSNTTVSYSFNVPAGAQTFTVVVEDVPVGPASNSPYTLSVSGACVGVCPVVPVLAANGTTLSQEGCPPPNSAVDPGELVTMNLKVINNGTAATSNLVGTLQASANVIGPSGPTSFGSIAPGATVGKDFSFTAAGNCGDLVTLALKLQDGAIDFGTVFYSFRLGVGTPSTQLTENFDGVTAPALPAGWSSTGSGAEPAWVTSTTNPFSAPNAAFAPNTATAGVTELVSPSILINGTPAQVSFRNAFNTESGFDGGVLEISINGGAYQDILAAGGSFVSGGYTGTMSTATQNPLTGRSGWTGLSGGTTATPAYITTVANLPAAAAGQNIQLKWRMGSDELIAATGTQPGQRVDNIVVSDTSYSCTASCNDAPSVTTNTGLIVTFAGTGTIGQSKLEATDPDNTVGQLSFTITTPPAHGTLKKNGIATSSFTQADINGNLITYTHNGDGATSDSFTFTLSDGTNNVTGQTFNITIGDPPANVQDAQAAEPASGTANMLFVVALGAPAGGSGGSVNYATQDEPAGPGKAVAGVCGSGGDYVATSGTLNFAAGQQFATISVPVCADGASEPDETFLVNLSTPVNLTISDGQAVGTITNANTAGTRIISELRTSGPAGAGDDFVELYNNTDSPLDASGFGLFKMGSACTDAPVLIAALPGAAGSNTTVIPARGHYLLVGSAYSLTAYAAGDQTLTSDIENDRNVGLFTTSNVNAISSANRLDAVGFGTNSGGNGICNLLREGTNLPAVSGSTSEYSYFRKLCDFVGGTGCATPGNPKDTNDNAADFMFADTQGTLISGVTQKLGAPGPENITSPIRRDTSGIGSPLLDGAASSSAPPNRARSFAMVSNGTFGTLTVRRRVVNNTGGPVTRLRFRIIELTTFPSPGGGVADLRALTSSNEASVSTSAGTVSTQGLTLEVPPNQTSGGGMNSTLTLTLGTPLADGDGINVNFLLGVQQTGTFRFLLIIEADGSEEVTTGPPTVSGNDGGNRKKARPMPESLPSSKPKQQ